MLSAAVTGCNNKNNISEGSIKTEGSTKTEGNNQSEEFSEKSVAYTSVIYETLLPI